MLALQVAVALALGRVQHVWLDSSHAPKTDCVCTKEKKAARGPPVICRVIVVPPEGGLGTSKPNKNKHKYAYLRAQILLEISILRA